ncbi:MAG: GGDEF domain-containing protein [Deltaproteobacteria bacterium]|nr:GGDEF domain-containing protein [Deltaproteobacteria bacterium]
MPAFFLDPRTSIVVLMGVSLILSITMNMIRLKRKTYPGFSLWTAGTTVATIAFLFLPLRNIISDIFSIVLSNILEVFTALLFLEGTRRFLGKEVRVLFVASVLVVYAIFQSFFTLVADKPDLRIIILSFLVAVLFGLTALELLLDVQSDFPFSHRLTGSLFAALSVFMFIHGIIACLFPPSQSMLFPGIFPSLTFILCTFLGVGWTAGFIMLNSEKMESELKQAQSRLQRMATTDFLTGIANNRLFLERGDSEIQRARRYKSSFSILMIDLDYFKNFNDNYGHAIGDKVLVAFVDICRNNLRDFDFFGRLGGEEFAVLLPHTDLDEGKRLAERLCSVIAQSDIEAEDKILRITVSIGVSQLLPGDDRIDDVLKRADDAMYDAKRKGRNQAAVFMI